MDKEKKLFADKYLLICENIISLLATALLFSLLALASIPQVSDFVGVLIIIFAFIVFFSAVLFALRLEQIAGYYECAKCHNRYVPTFKSVLFASHFGRTRHLRCPNCHKKSWSRKVLEK